MSAKAETALKRAILDALQSIGVTAWNCPSGIVQVKRGWAHLAPKGTADIIGYLPGGRMLALEVKRPGEKRTPEQIAWWQKAQRHGVAATVVTSVRETLAFVRESLPTEAT